MTTLIVNPSAGAGRALRRVAAMLPTLQRHFPDLRWCLSRSASHITEIAASAAADDAPLVIVAGGDGTVHHAANGLVGTQTPLAILPVGTGNDIATSVGVPDNLGDAIELFAMRHVRTIDLGEVDGRVFCCVLGVGMDTAALHRINHARWLRRGRLLYTLAAVQTLLSYRPRELSIAWDGGEIVTPTVFAAVTNTASYAGGMSIAPDAEVDDALLDLCVIPQMPRPRLLRTFAKIQNGAHRGVAGVRLEQGSTFTIRDTEGTPLPITLDGEITDLTTDAKIRLRAHSLRLLGAPRAPHSAPRYPSHIPSKPTVTPAGRRGRP